MTGCLRTVALAVTFGTPAVWAQTGDSLTADIGRALVEEDLVGATWSIVTPAGSTVGAAGLKDAPRKVPMSPDDRMQVGSIAKALIATGVLRLVTEGRVSLDAPVALYLPDAPIDNPWERTSRVTVRHLLDHSSGLEDARMWQVFSLQAEPDAPLIDGLVRQGGSVKVRYRPGHRSSYSNTGYVLLGMLIEAVTGMRYEAWLGAELLAPLGMTRSTFAFVTQSGPQADPTLAMGHFEPQVTSAAVPSHLRPASQFTTTAGDMARFAHFLMGDGRIAGRLLVDGALLRAMAVPTTTESARAGLAAGYALGLMRRDRHGVVGKCHLGNLGTFRAALCLFPEQQRAFFISHNIDPEHANFDRIDALLVNSLGLQSPAEQTTKPPGVDPARWTGFYQVRPNRFAQFAYLDELTGLTQVHWEGGALLMRPLRGAPRRLTPLGGAFFRAPDRREATHVLLQSNEGRPLISDGLRTYERIRPLAVVAHLASASAGLLAVLYLLVVGGVRSVQALRRAAWRSEPLRWPATCLVLMLAAPLLYLGQSFLAIGDPTPANVVVALVTGALPFVLVVAAVHRLRAGLRAHEARLDMFALAFALQWCVVLAAWGMLPFALWR